MKTIYTLIELIRSSMRRITILLMILLGSIKMVHAQNCTINAGVNTSYCAGDQMTLFGNVAGLYNNATITWSQVSGPAVTIANTHSLTTSCGTAALGATYVFRLSSQCQDGSNIFNDVTYTVAAATPTPPAANAGSTINAGCVQWGNTIALNATPAPAGFIGTWSIVSGGSGTFSNVNSATATFRPTQERVRNPDWTCGSVSNTYVLRWALKSTTTSACPSAVTTSSADVTINTSLWNSVNARVTVICGTGAANLYGTCPGSGTPTWSLVAGPAGYSFSPVNSQNVSLSSLPNGVYTFLYSVSGACVNGAFNLTFFISTSTFPLTTANANAGNIQTSYCGSVPAFIRLSANKPLSSETGTWLQNSGSPVTFSDIHDPNATVTGLTVSGGPYTFLWQITGNSGCLSSSPVTISTAGSVPIVPAINASTNCSDAVLTEAFGLCVSRHYIQLPVITVPISAFSGWYIDGYSLNTKPSRSSFILGYTPAIVQNSSGVFWSAVSTCNGIEYSTLFDNNFPSVIQLALYFKGDLTPGIYTGTFKIKNGNCTDISFDVPFTFTIAHTPTTSNAGTDQNLACNVTQTNLAGNDPAVTSPFIGIGFWNQVSGPNTAAMADQYNRTTQISSLIPGTYKFAWIVTGGDLCPSNQDTVVVRVSNTLPQPVTAGTNQSVCFGSPATLTANLVPSGNLAAMLSNTGSTGTWTQVSGPAGVTITNPNNISTTVTGLAASSVYVFRYTASNLCGSTQANVSITTTATQGPSVAIAGVNSCLAAGVTTVNLSATIPSVGTGAWSKLNVGDPGTITNPAAATTTVTGVNTNGVHGYIWTVSNGGCTPTTATVFISNTGPLSAAVARPDLDTCAAGGGNTFQLYATPPVNGTGTWSQISGPVGATYNSNIANPVVTVASGGQYIFRWTVSNGVCTDNTDDVKINFYNNPGIAVTLTQDTTLCGNSSGQLTLRAATPASGAGSWSVVSNGPVSITNPSSPVTTAILNPGTTRLRWTVAPATAVCPGSMDDIIVKYVPAANAKNDIILCSSTSVLLNSSNPGSGTGSWSMVSPPFVFFITNYTRITDSTYAVSTTPANSFGNGVFTFRWTVTNASCPSSFDDKVVTFNTVSPNAGVDVCGTPGNPVTLNGSSIPLGATALWSVVSIPAGATPGTFSAPNAATTSYNTPNVTGFYDFKYKMANATCSDSDYVRVAVTGPVSASASTLNYCDNAAGLNLFGSNPSPGFGRWTVLSQPAGSPPVLWTNQNTQNANVKRLTIGTYVFRYIVEGTCNASPFQDVTINSNCFILPVKLSYIKATGISCKLNRLNWHSETEDNFSRYELEYSVDGNNFALLSTLNPKGNTSDYNYDHPLPYYKTFYRLKMVDIDGKYAYSSVVSVINPECNKQSLSLFPVPADKELIAQLQSETNQPASLSIYDMNGKLISSSSINLVKGSNRLTVNIGKLAKGMYYLKVENDKLNEKSVFIKN